MTSVTACVTRVGRGRGRQCDVRPATQSDGQGGVSSRHKRTKRREDGLTLEPGPCFFSIGC